ncbi:hypothetical protein CVT26_008820 [Gymnopilus dilepis]|uniref:ATP-dependent DNA helicase n=1 Tax=Gymnopilus dilepis TaxID=231916 RepID=A0A409X6V9_9AGAR|nr:hypothetical protein CVT26_008820 [Gymnopilus dilepis]
MIQEFTLNTEQARAFRLVAEHSLDRRNEPLKMYLGGPGGTGKSRVINALKEFFSRKGQSRRFRLASFAGIAAKNISGMTVHSALLLNQRGGKAAQSKTKRDLVSSWEGVDYFFIDEVSTISCKLLSDISDALVDAKSNTAPFGGVNMILAGDFAQLPPVRATRLSAAVDTNPARTTKPYAQGIVAGKLLWQSFTKVVMLTQIMRQAGNENKDFVDLLMRLRTGTCTDDDHATLSHRLIQNQDVNPRDWEDTPIIVSGNAQKDALNDYAAAAFAARTNQELHWYHAVDTHRGKQITDGTLKRHLQSLHSGLTNQRLGKIPLVIGMPVMIGQNYDLEGGIVNGCMGKLRKIRYKEDEHGNRYATSCVVECDSISCEALHGLPPNHAVVLEDTVDMTFEHPHSGKKCKIKRTQLPLTPAFALTAHKAQGQTMPKALVDIQSCRGTESPYVMISRVTSLQGLLILRPFDTKKIKCRQSEDVRKEMTRLETLRWQTIAEIGSLAEKRTARKMLKTRIDREQESYSVNQPLKRPRKVSQNDNQSNVKKRRIAADVAPSYGDQGLEMDVDIDHADAPLRIPKKVQVL